MASLGRSEIDPDSASLAAWQIRSANYHWIDVLLILVEAGGFTTPIWVLRHG